MDGMYWLMLASRVLHILSAVVLVGGVFYLRMVVTPSAPTGVDWPAGRRAAWAKWVGIATLLLVVTGLLNFIVIVKTNEPMGSPYHPIFGVKFLLALAVFFLAAVLASGSAASERFRQQMNKWLGVCLALGVLIIVLAGVLRSLPHVPKTDSVTPPLLIEPTTGRPPGE